MPNLRLISVNAAGGATVNVVALRWSRRVEAIEDEGNGNSPQGFSTQTPLDNFVSQRGIGPGTEPLIIQNSMSQGGGTGPIIGMPQQGSSSAFNFQAATNILQNVISLGAGTVLAVTEFE
jgi:hypothetical protein